MIILNGLLINDNLIIIIKVRQLLCLLRADPQLWQHWRLLPTQLLPQRPVLRLVALFPPRAVRAVSRARRRDEVAGAETSVVTAGTSSCSGATHGHSGSSEYSSHGHGPNFPSAQTRSPILFMRSSAPALVLCSRRVT